MGQNLTFSIDDAFVVQGKFALPYQYFAGETGSTFLTTLRDKKKIMGVKCSTCGKVFVPPRTTCDLHIHATCDEWVELPGTGVLKGFTVVRYSHDFLPEKPPYILGLIALDGADSQILHIIKGVSPQEVKPGMKVEARFAEHPQENTIRLIDHFAPKKKSAFNLGYSYDELSIGMSASFSKTITETDVYLFAGISGDFNPMHVNEEFAKMTPFGTRIAHGALPQSLIAPVLGMKLPGLGTVAVEITVRFKAPTYFGDTITATATVAEKLEEKKWVRMDCLFSNQHGKVVATGSALVIPPPKM